MRVENFDTYLITGKWETETIEGQTVSTFTEPVQQDFIILNNKIYLSAVDGDMTTDGVTINENAGGQDDIMIGNATSKSLSVTLLSPPNDLPYPPFPKNLLEGIDFGVMRAFNGYKESETTFTVPSGANCYLTTGTHTYYGTNTAAYMDGSAITAGNGIKWIGISLMRTYSGASSYPIFYSDQGILEWNGSSYTFLFYEDITDFNERAFMCGKYAANGYSCWWANVLDGSGQFYKWDCETGIKETWRYLPVGIFDFSDVSVYGSVYTAEVYDLMSLIEASGTKPAFTVWQGLGACTPSQYINSIASYCNTNISSWIQSSASISASAVNTSTTITAYPFGGRQFTLRDALAFLAEAIGCNVRLSARGQIEFYTYGTTPVQAKYESGGILVDQNVVITSDSIQNETRYKSRYIVPQIDALNYVATTGLQTSVGSGSNPYWMTSNPVLESMGTLSTVLTNIYNLLNAIPQYYNSQLTVINSIPMLEPGDLVTIQNREDNTTYYALLTESQQHWCNINVSSLTAKGNQQRASEEVYQSYIENGESTASLTEKLNGSIKTVNHNSLLGAGNVNAIYYGAVDGTSTATAFTASIADIPSYYDGLTVVLKNGIITSASGFTININGLGAKNVYTNMAAATQETTKFNVNYTMMFIYDSTRVAGGCWVCYNGYDSNSNTIGYQLRTNSTLRPAADKGYRYRLWFTSVDGTKWVPANTSSATNATTARTPNTRAIDPFGEIVYYSTNGTTEANANLAATTCWQQYVLSLGYSFNTTGAALTLTNPAPVYLKCTPQATGGVTMDGYVQALPTTEDGKVYIFLGMAYSATNIELFPVHPVYYYADGSIRLWTGHKVGEQVASTGTAISLASNTSFNDLASFSLTPGVWQVNLCVKYAANAAGRRFAHLATTSMGAQISEAWCCQVRPVDGGSTWMHWSNSLKVTTNTTYYICGYQNSGSPLSTTAMWDCVRIR